MFIHAPEVCQHGTHTNGTAYTRGTYSRVHTHTNTHNICSLMSKQGVISTCMRVAARVKCTTKSYASQTYGLSPRSKSGLHRLGALYLGTLQHLWRHWRASCCWRRHAPRAPGAGAGSSRVWARVYAFLKFIREQRVGRLYLCSRSPPSFGAAHAACAPPCPRPWPAPGPDYLSGQTTRQARPKCVGHRRRGTARRYRRR